MSKFKFGFNLTCITPKPLVRLLTPNNIKYQILSLPILMLSLAIFILSLPILMLLVHMKNIFNQMAKMAKMAVLANIKVVFGDLECAG